ncbi:MAG: hypothetical protein QM652_09645 [Legionella sp.]|uniref:hypothetical protein n=1 Tax=Legionella sp. TaxID=459 RepID=UPI0039E46071
MENNRAQALTAQLKDLQRRLSLIKARRDTEHDLPRELKYQLWVESKQLGELIDRIIRRTLCRE